VIKLTYDNILQRGDLVRGGQNLTDDVDLETAVLISLLTERRAAPDDDLPAGLVCKGGWWGDTYLKQPWGSRLWQLRRSVATPKTVARAKAYIEEALAWLVQDGVAKSVVVRTSRGENPTQLKYSVDIARPGVVSTWSRSWEVQLNAL
jgi:phage gp46-like protein